MTATLAESVTVTEPGVYQDLPAAAYHADCVPGGSLSSSGARKLLPPSCPALYKFERDNPPESTKTFEIGNAAHTLVLGVGPEIVVVDSETWNTNAVKAEVAGIRDAGKVPVKPSMMAELTAMADALRRHPLANALLSDGGQAETSLFWRDDDRAVMRRCRLDWNPAPRTGRQVAWDYKTSKTAEPNKFAKSAMDYGYHQQAAWNLDGLRALDLADNDAQFLFIVQEKTAPYLVSVVQLDVVDMRIGRLLNRRAIDVYAKCVETGVWPGYSDDEVAHVSLPYFYERQFEDEL